MANDITLHFIQQVFSQGKNLTFAEIGIDQGSTSLEIARFLTNKGTLHLFDYQDVVEKVADKLISLGMTNIATHGCSRCSLDSYNWNLMKIMKEQSGIQFDYVYLDGAHTWSIDGLAFFLCDMLLKQGGFIDFDDYFWTHASSPTCNPKVFPNIAKMYTLEQIATPQVNLIVDLIVRKTGRYQEVIPNKIFMKIK